MDGTVNVFLLAENRLLREALAKIVKKKADVNVVGDASFCLQAVEQIVAAGPDVLVLDSAMYLADVEFLLEVRRLLSDLKLLMIGMDPDEQTFLQAIRAGAVGYVLKDASASDVISAIRAVAQGEGICPPRMCRFMFDQMAQQSKFSTTTRVRIQEGLTRREQQLVPLIAQGLTNKEIAKQLNLSEQTIKNHIHRIIQKVGSHDRMSVGEWYLRAVQ
ncbi:MAG: LuxR C-terminal-related transcriptional regulator [Candidatus Acidiferrales bacterium]